MKKDLTRLFHASLYPVAMIALMWVIKIIESAVPTDFYTWGIYPLHTEGLKGIIFSPFIHGSYEHLISNTFPLLILGTALFYFYHKLGLAITIFSWIMSGIWVWVFARESYHIGASGIIYSWAAFLFVSGVIRDHPRLMALSLLIAFLYGSMVWGIFPLRERMSWEGHLMGLLAGIVLALFYKEKGPQRKKYSWEIEEEEENDEIVNPENPPYWMQGNAIYDEQKGEKNKPNEASKNEQPINYFYSYKENRKNNQKDDDTNSDT
ncbi:MAG: rhomboid family intramembrane serine protease [Bacteroidales bacterium]